MNTVFVICCVYADQDLVDVVLRVLPFLADNATHVCVVIPSQYSAYVQNWITEVRANMAERDSLGVAGGHVEFTNREKKRINLASSKMFAFSTALGGLVRHSVNNSRLLFGAVVDLVQAFQGPVKIIHLLQKQ